MVDSYLPFCPGTALRRSTNSTPLHIMQRIHECWSIVKLVVHQFDYEKWVMGKNLLVVANADLLLRPVDAIHSPWPFSDSNWPLALRPRNMSKKGEPML